MSPTDFGALLRRLRQAAGLSQEALAEVAQISVSAIGAYERGIHAAPHRETVAMLARALGLGDAQRAEFELVAQRKPRATVRDGKMPPALNVLPHETNSFVGRDEETGATEELLRRQRCVTITGIGGIGKTRLALHVARRMSKTFADGAVFVDLGAIADGSLVLAKAASAFGLQLADGDSDIERFAMQLRSKSVLIVLDNCEHVIQIAADLVSALLRTAKDVSVLSTSRERLRVSGEAVYRLAPLLPSAASTLFAERATTLEREFALTADRAGIVVDVCRKLDGIPLALELAASRVSTLGLQTLQTQLTEQFAILSGGNRDVPTRQRTLDATLAWSFDLLEPREAVLFRRLGVFAGGWTLDAAQAVCADEALMRDDILEVLPSLVEKSLVNLAGDAEPPRYHMLRLARMYASEKALSAGETTANARNHARWMASLAQRAHKEIVMARRAWHARYDQELDNMRAAIDWSLIDEGEPLYASEIITGFIQVWSDNGLIAEHRHWTKRSLERLDEAEHPREVALLFRMLMKTGVGQERIAAGERAIALFSELEDPVALAHALGAQASLLQKSADVDLAAEAADRAAQLYAENGLDDTLPFAYVMTIRASLAAQQGEFEEACRQVDAAAAIAGELHDDAFISYIGVLSANFEFLRGNVQRALQIVDETLLTARQMGFRHDEMLLLCNRACYLIEQGQTLNALADAAAGLRLARDNDPLLVAVAILHVAAASALLQNPEPAARLMGFVDRFHESAGIDLYPADRRSYDRALAALRGQLSETTLRNRLNEGTRLDATVAIDEALRLSACATEPNCR